MATKNIDGNLAVTGNITTSNISVATSTDLETGLANKQAALVSGENIKTVNGDSLLGAGNIDVNNLSSITWAELKTLRDNGNLVPGRFYRITDYICIPATTQGHLSNSGHTFDIIVVADDESALNENARAILHEGDTYFVNNNLAAWQLKYCLDNDTSRFDWAAYSGKGVIYWMRDEFGNEAPYDFKNIIFIFAKSFNYSLWGYDWTFVRDSSLDANGYFGWRAFHAGTGFPLAHSYCFTDTEAITPSSTLYSNSSGSVISYGGTIDRISTNEFSSYTFCYVIGGVMYDASIAGGTQMCFNNFIGEYRVNGVLRLNWTVFYSYSSGTLQVYNNHIAEDNYYNIISANFYDNAIGSYFHSNTINQLFYDNTIGSYFYSNTIGSRFNFNTISTNFCNNVTGYDFYNNTINSNFKSNSIGSNFKSNTIGSYFYSNNIGSCFTYNTLGSNVYQNIIGAYFERNTLDSNFYQNIIGVSAPEDVYVRYCKFDDGVQYISLTSADTDASHPNYLQNVHIHSDVKGTSSSRLSIIVPDRALAYETEYYLDESGNLIVSNFGAKITWASLKALRDTGNLVPGKKYRITDYACTTVQLNTSSAGHAFDIIVIADSNAKLNENASAIIHDGDAYFSSCKLEAWQLKYCLDNDTARFAWADSTNGKGVIFWLRDEFGNECPYDFKNIIYEVKPAFSYVRQGDTFTFVRDSSLDSGDYYGWRSSSTPSSWSNPYCFTTVEVPTTSMTLYSNTSGTVISYAGTITPISTTEYDSYTFNYMSSGVNYDASIAGLSKNCYNNIIKEHYSLEKLQLNRNIFHSTSASFDCYSNIFGFNCYSNIFTGACYYNTFGNYCYSNALSYSSRNIFGDGCYSNIFGASCDNNTFGSGCYSNTFGVFCQYNAFGSGCSFNAFGDYCYYNTFGNYCRYNTFGDSSSAINYCRYIIFDNGCSYIYLYSDDIDASSSNYLQNVHINLGVKGTSSSRLSISVADRNNAFTTTYQTTGHIEIDV